MRLFVTTGTVRVLRWGQRALFAVAASMLMYCGYVLVDTWRFQKTERAQLDTILTIPVSSKRALPPAGSGGLIGRIDIASLGLSAVLMEGTTGATLRRAVGHISGTALPGQQGNVAISGHRDTFFRPLRKIHSNDIITLTTLAGEFRYRVTATKIVRPSDVSVLDPEAGETLTLITCYPFYFVGPAPERFIVRAERIT